jgi:hypothetical protein
MVRKVAMGARVWLSRMRNGSAARWPKCPSAAKAFVDFALLTARLEAAPFQNQRRKGIFPQSLYLLMVVSLAPGVVLAQRADTTAGFNDYVTQAEARIARERSNPKTFLDVDSLPSGERAAVMTRLRQGEVVIEKRGNTPQEIAGGLVHDWVGVVLIPGASVEQVVAMVRDYDHLAPAYSPDVMQSRLISSKGDDLHVFMRLHKQKVVTVVLDTEYDVHYGRIDAAHQFSISRSTRVSEIEDAGTAKEHALPAGHDHGFMWRLNSYWEFEQAADGVLVQCEAISLTRDIPTGLGWLIGPFVSSIPRESLQFTLTATRTAGRERAIGTDRAH